MRLPTSHHSFGFDRSAPALRTYDIIKGVVWGRIRQGSAERGGKAIPLANRFGTGVSSKSRRPGFSIQSKLLVMLLSVSIGSSLVVGLVGYASGSDSLKQAAYDRVTEMRQSKAREITDFFTTTENSLVVYTRGTTAINAVQAFTAG